MQNLIIVKQLPQIEEHLKELSIEVDKKVKNAKNLICTEENVKAIKQIRAELNKEFKDIEQQRKAVKEQVLAPYMQFEDIYKEYISNKYRSADNDLKQKVDSVESELKTKKEKEVKDYFEEYITANNIDFITYEQIRINVTLTASMKSLKGQIKEFIDKVVDDLKLIETQQHRTEILIEYKNTLNVSNAITTVMNRFKAIEEEKQKQIEVVNKRLEEEQKTIQNNLNQLANTNIPTSNVNTAQQIQQKVYTIPFKATGTSVQLKMLKDFMEREGIEYESITDNQTKI